MPVKSYTKIELSPLVIADPGKESVLKTLAYFDIFHYPLTKEEVQQFLERSITGNRLEILLRQLCLDKTIFLHNNFYSLQNNPLLGYRRKQGNARAKQMLEKATRIGKFLYRFPFVRAVAISGSLSKNFADEKADIDFFIITKANHLWIARTLMHLFKKLTFITGRQHLYCMNYFLDETSLLINNKNIFTATEIKTLLPVRGSFAMQQFFEANEWTNDLLPCSDFRQQETKDPKVNWFKNFIETILNKRMTGGLDNYLMRVTKKRWENKRRKGKQNKKGATMELVTGKNYSFSNPGAFQEKVLTIYEDKLAKLKLL